MKYILILLSFVTLAFVARAQPGTQGPPPGGGGPSIIGHISGTVVDSLTKSPLDYATISIFPSGSKTPLSGVITDEKGNFKFENMKPGSYKLTVSYLGYPTKIIDPVVTTLSKPDKNIGIVPVAPGKHTLNEVSVVGQASLIENKIDKVVYNVEKDITASGGTATDVLGKVPMVSVDMNGNVSVRGDQNVKVLINGKTTGASAANIADVLRAIPADQIKNIEVITSPSAKYDAEGSAGIINIVTRQKNVSGISGSINGGVGTRQNNGNMNLNYNAGRFHLSTNIGGFLSWPQTSTSDFEQNIHDTTTSTKGTSRVSRHAINGSVSAGYDFNAYNIINSTFRFMNFQFNTDGSSNTLAMVPYTNTSTATNSFSNFDWNVDYTHKFKQEGQELDFSTQWSHGTGMNNYQNIYSAAFPSIKNNIEGINNEYTFQLDYTQPLSKVFKLEAGAKSIIRRINSTSDYYDDQSGDFVYDPLNSNIYNYNQDVYAGYSVLTITLPGKWSILAGLRDENTNIHGDPVNISQNLSPFSQNYNTIVPSLTLQRQLNGNNTIKLVYSKRITRPSLQFLNPFTNESNKQSQTVGNPELNPEISHTYELDYNAFFGSSSLNASVYYKHTANLIEGIATPITIQINDTTKAAGTLTKYQNIGSNNSFGGSLFGNVTPFRNFTITGNINAYTYQPDPSGTFIADKTQNGTYIMYNGFLRGSLTLPADLIAEAFGFGGSARRTIQGTNPAFALYGIGLRKQFMQKKMSVGVNVLQPFANYKHFDSSISSPGISQTSITQVPFRSFGLTFSYSFGKMSFSNPNQKKGINNDDLKQGDQNQQQGGMGGGANR